MRPSREGVRGGRGGRLALALLALLAGGWDLLEAPDPAIERGTRAFRAGRYADALAAFQTSESSGPAVDFDIGTALYKQAEAARTSGTLSPAAIAELYQRAETAFRAATEAQSGVLRSAAYHNLGNALFRRGNLGEAVQAYRRALRANPRNQDARFNLEVALRAMGSGQAPSPGPGSAPPGPGQSPGQGPSGTPPPSGSGADAGPGAAPASPEAPDESPPEEPPAAPEPPPGAPLAAPPGKDEAAAPVDRPGVSAPPRDGAEDDRESEHKLERLEERSRELRRRLLRGAGQGYDRARTTRDW